MSIITVQDGSLVLPAEGPVTLPPRLSLNLLTIMLTADPDEPTHLARYYRRLSRDDQERLERCCLAYGEDSDIRRMWGDLALSWQEIGSDTGKWDLASMRLVYREPINSWLIKDLFATEAGRWYGVNDDGRIFSSAELSFTYGQTMVEHIQRYLAFENVRIGRTLEAMGNQFVEREIQVMVDGGLMTVRRSGPPFIHPREWLLRPGETFVSTL